MKLCLKHNESENGLLRGGFLLTFAIGMSGILGYAYQIIMARMLSPAEYSVFSAGIGLALFACSPFGTISMVVSIAVSKHCAANNLTALAKLYGLANGYLVIFAAFLMLVIIATAPLLQKYLKSTNLEIAILLGAFVIASSFLNVNNGFFQGLQKFEMLGGLGFVGMLLKLTLGIAFVAIGLETNGAIAGLTLAIIITWYCGFRSIYFALPKVKLTMKDWHFHKLRNNSILPVLMANICFVAMTQLDMVLVNYYFPTEIASKYAVASALGKVILYLPGGIALALFPMTARRHAFKQDSYDLLAKAVSVTIIVCAIAVYANWLLSDFIIELLFGIDYTGAGELLRWYGLMIFPMSMVTVAENFLLAQGKMLFAWIFLIMAPIQVGLVHYYHSTIWDVFMVIGITGSVLTLLGYLILWQSYRITASVVSP